MRKRTTQGRQDNGKTPRTAALPLWDRMRRGAVVNFPDGSQLVIETDLARNALLRDSQSVNYNDLPPPPKTWWRCVQQFIKTIAQKIILIDGERLQSS